MAKDDANSSLITISVIENLVTEINDCLSTLTTESPEQYELIRATAKAVNNLQTGELFNLRKSFEKE